MVGCACRSTSQDKLRHWNDKHLLALLSRLPDLATIAANGITAARLARKVPGRHAICYRFVQPSPSIPADTLPDSEKLRLSQLLRE